MIRKRPSRIIISQLWKLFCVGITVYLKKFGVSAFGLPQLPSHLKDIPLLDPSIGFGLYAGTRIATNLDFSNDPKEIKLENITEALIQACPRTYFIFQDYLNQAKDEKDFFKRFVQVSQSIVIVHYTMGILLLPNLNHHSNFIKESVVLTTAAGAVSSTAREMAKAIERSESVDNWTLNFLFYMRKFLPKSFLEKLENYLTSRYFEMKSNPTNLNNTLANNTLANITQANINPAMITMVCPNILESKFGSIIINLLKLTFYLSNKGFLGGLEIFSTSLQLIRIIPQDNTEFEISRVLLQQNNETRLMIINNYLKKQLFKIGPLTLRIRKQLVNITGLKSDLDRLVMNFIVKYRLDQLILNLIAIYAFLRLLLGIDLAVQQSSYHPIRRPDLEIHRLLPDIPCGTSSQNLEMEEYEAEKISEESNVSKGQTKNVKDVQQSKNIDFIDAEIISGTSENENSHNQNQQAKTDRISNNKISNN